MKSLARLKDQVTSLVHKMFINEIDFYGLFDDILKVVFSLFCEVLHGEPLHAEELGLMESHRRLIENIRQRYKYIKQNLDPSDKVIDELYQIKLIGRKCRESVLPLARSDRARAIDKIIKDLVRKLEKLDDNHYEIKEANLLRIFSQYGYMYMLEVETMAQNSEDDTTLDLTEAEMKRIFNNEQNKELLKNELEPRRLIDNLLESGALSFDDHEDVQQTAHRYQRVIALLMYIRSDVLKKGPVFLKAIKANYPKLMKKLTDNLHTSGCEVAHAGVQLSVAKQECCRVVKIVLHDDTDITVRLKFNGNHGEITMVEREIVDSPHPELDTEAMECETNVTDMYVSSVVIRLHPLSARAAKKLTDMLNQPDGLKQWLTKLLNDDQLDKLKQAGWNSISIEVNLLSPADKSDMLCGCLITKQLLERDTMKTLFCEQLQDVDRVVTLIYDMCRLTYGERKEMARFSDCSDSGKKKEAFINFLTSLSEDFLCVFEIALRKTGQASLLERCAESAGVTGDLNNRNLTENSHRYLKRCTSLCSRDIIKELVDPVRKEGIKELDKFLDELVGHETLSDVTLQKIHEIQAMPTDKTEEVLKLLTDLSQSCTCRLEQFLKETTQNNVLQYFKQFNELLGIGEITKDEVKENYTFLLHELEPKIFSHILPDTEQASVPTEDCRTDRCRVFLEKLLESDHCDVNVRKFVKALNQLKLYHILKVLNSSKRSKNMERARVFGDILKHKILEKKPLIMDEVDITMLKATFVDRRVFTKEQFDILMNKESRRECVVALLKEMFQKGYPAMVCFIAALKLSGYIFVAGSIENVPDPVLPCPCLADATGSQTLLRASFAVELMVKDEEDTGSDKMKGVQDGREHNKVFDKPIQNDVDKTKPDDHSVQKNGFHPHLNSFFDKQPPALSQDKQKFPCISTEYKDILVKPCSLAEVESSSRSQSENILQLQLNSSLPKRPPDKLAQTKGYVQPCSHGKAESSAKLQNGTRQYLFPLVN